MTKALKSKTITTHQGINMASPTSSMSAQHLAVQPLKARGRRGLQHRAIAMMVIVMTMPVAHSAEAIKRKIYGRFFSLAEACEYQSTQIAVYLGPNFTHEMGEPYEEDDHFNTERGRFFCPYKVYSFEYYWCNADGACPLSAGGQAWKAFGGEWQIWRESYIDIFTSPPNGGGQCGNPSHGNPIYPMTGAKREVMETGVTLGWGGNPLILTYDSQVGVLSRQQKTLPLQAPVYGDLGEMWFSSFHRTLSINGNSKNILAVRGNGAIASFHKLSTDSAAKWSATPDNKDTLTLSGNFFTIIEIKTRRPLSTTTARRFVPEAC